MFNPLKELFVSKSVVGLQVSEGQMGAVEIQNTIKGPEVSRVGFREVKDPQNIGEELKEFFSHHGFSREWVVSALPANNGYFRTLALNFENPNKIARVIKYQLEPHVPQSIENMVVDFVLPPTPEGLVTVGIEKTILREHLENLSVAGIDPEQVGLDVLSLFFLFTTLGEQDEEDLSGIYYVDNDLSLFLIISQNSLDFLRILKNDESSAAEQLAKSLKLYSLKNNDREVREILLTGSGANQELADAVASGLETKTSLWMPFEALKQGKDKLSETDQARLSVPLGLALTAITPPQKKFDLRKEEFVPKTSISLKRMGIYALSVLVLCLVLLTFNFYQRVQIQKTRYEALRGRIGDVLTQTFPDLTMRVKGQELAQMRQKMDEERGQFEWLEGIHGQGKILDILSILTATVSTFPNTTVENLSIEEGDIRLDGQTSSFETVDKIKENLSNVDDFDVVELVGAKKDKNKNAVTFNLALERKK